MPSRDEILRYLLDSLPLVAATGEPQPPDPNAATPSGAFPPPDHAPSAPPAVAAPDPPHPHHQPLMAAHPDPGTVYERLAHLDMRIALHLCTIADEIAVRSNGPADLPHRVLDWLEARHLLTAQARRIAESFCASGGRNPLPLLLGLGLVPCEPLAQAWGLPAPADTAHPPTTETLADPPPAPPPARDGTPTLAAHAPAPAADPTAAPAPEPAELRPLDPDRYEVKEEIGRGGMGVVYRAWDRELGRTVALKTLLLDRAAGDSARARFHKEALACARLRHPHIVQLHDVGTWRDTPCLVMEFIAGTTLTAWTAATDLARPGACPRAARLVAQVAEAVAYAHKLGVVHRDIKPDNVLVDPDGNAFLTDYGLAREIDSETRLTQSGAVMGTPGYMAPEQAGGVVDSGRPATDIYALGALLYYVLCGRPPFEGPSVAATLYQVLHKDPVPPRRIRPALPADLETVCLRALEKEPERRYASAQEVADELARFLAGEPVRAVPPGTASRAWRRVRRNPVTAALAAAGLVVVAAALAWGARAADRARAEHRLREEAAAAESARAAARDEAARRVARARHAHGNEAIALYTEALARDPASGDALLGRAREFRDLGRHAEAIADCDRALAAAAAPADALYLRGTILRDHLGRTEDAVRDFTRLSELDPGRDAGLLAIALVRAEQGKPAEALALLDQAARRDPKNPETRLARARIHLAGGDPARARREADAAISLRPEASDAWLVRAQAGRAAGDRAAATEDLRRLLELNPQHVGGLALRAALRAETGELDAALADLDRILALRPEAVEHRLTRSRLHLQRNDFHAALADLAEIERREPGRREHRVLRAETLTRAGRFPEALESWKELCAGADTKGEDFVWRGVVRMLLGDGPGFLLDMTEVWKRRVKTEEVFLRAAEAARALGRSDVTEMLLHSVGRTVPTNDRAAFELGRALAARGEWRVAAKEFARTARLRGEQGAAPEAQAEAWACLAEARLRAGDVEPALEAAGHALTLAAGERRARTTRAAAWVRTGRPAEALADLEAVLRADPGDAWALATRAEACRVAGDARAAARAVEAALAADPALAPAYVCRADLRTAAGDEAGARADLACATQLEPALVPALADRLARLRPAAATTEAAAGDAARFAALEQQTAGLAAEPALAAWTAWLATHRDDGAARLRRGRLYAALGRPFAARDDFLEAIDRTPPAIEARFALAELQRAALADPAAALREFDRIERLHRRDADLFLGRARAWIDLKNPTRAIAEVGQALVIDARRAAAYALRGRLYLDAGLAARALDDLNRAAALVEATGPAADAARADRSWSALDLYLVRGRAQLALGNPAAARGDLDRYLAGRAEDPTALLARAECALALGAREDAARDAKGAAAFAADEPTRTRAAALLARARSVEGDLTTAMENLLAAVTRGAEIEPILAPMEEAGLDAADPGPWQRALDAALEAHPESVPLRAARLRAELGAGRLAEAADDAARLAERGGPEGAACADLRAAIEKGQAGPALATRGLERAAAAAEGEAGPWYDLAVAASARAPEALRARAAWARGQGRFEAAVRDLARVIRLVPADLKARLDRVRILAFDLKDKRRTLEAVEATAAPAAQDAEALALLGRAVAWHGEVDRAIELHGRGIAADPQYFDNWGERGLHYLRRSDWTHALPDLERAVALQKDNVHYLCKALAECYAGLGREKDAEAAMNRAVAAAPAGSAEMLRERAYFYLARERWQEARDDVRKALELPGGRDAQALFCLGTAEVNLGHYQEALDPLREALKLQPRFAEASYLLALALARLRDLAGARAAASGALAERADWAEPWYLRAQVNLLLEDPAAALADLRKARELKPAMAAQIDELIRKAEEAQKK